MKVLGLRCGERAWTTLSNPSWANRQVEEPEVPDATSTGADAEVNRRNKSASSQANNSERRFCKIFTMYGWVRSVLINHADMGVGLERQPSPQTSFSLSRQQETMSNLTTQRTNKLMARLR